MDFLKLDLSSLESVQEVSVANDGTSKPSLPAPKSFTLEDEALRFYLPLIDNPPVTPAKPRIGGPDATRLSNQTQIQFADDWPLIKPHLSPERRQQCIEAYYHLGGLRMAWLLTSKLLEPSSKKEGIQVLQTSRELRDRLLGLAQSAYANHPDLLDKIDSIYALSRPNNSLYDEMSTDLSETVALFTQNPFTEQGYVSFPSDLLTEATKLAGMLPLLAPRETKATGVNASPPTHQDAPMIYRAFGVFEACVNQLASVGRFARFGQKQAHILYPLLAASQRSAGTKPKDTQEDSADPLQSHKNNFG